jgi:lantibiotic biosynthesis protein
MCADRTAPPPRDADVEADLTDALAVIRSLAEAGSPLLHDATSLSDQLYVAWFHTIEVATSRRYPSAGEFAAATAVAEGFRPGWTLVALGIGGVVARSPTGTEVALAMGDVAPERPLDRARAGARLRALDRAVGSSDGFWHLWSSGWREQPPRAIDRCYLAVAPGAETAVAQALATTAPPDGTWYAKFLTGDHPPGRRDPAVLYVPAGEGVAPWLPSFATAAAEHLPGPRARLTVSLAPGLGLARDPGGGRSFGQAVCDAIAAAAVQGGTVGVDELAAAVDELLRTGARTGATAADLPTTDPSAPQAPALPVVITASPAVPPSAVPERAADHRALGVDEDALAAGLDLAETLAASAVWDGEVCAFQGATASPTPGRPAHWRAFGGEYYDGSAGIARLLAHAAALGASAEVARTARGAIEHALLRAEGWSLHSGRLGAGLVAREAGTLLEHPGLARRGHEVCHDAAHAAAAAPSPVALDLLAGLAGVLHAVSHLAAEDRSTWLPLADRLASRLATAATERPVGHSWGTVEGASDHLCGLAHGAAGFALAFEDLAAGAAAGADGSPPPPDRDPRRWRTLAAAARRFERTHLDPVACSWADLRVDPTYPDAPPGHPHYWCHGSIGVGHERLRAVRQRPDDPLVAADALTALTAARREAERIAGGPAGPGVGFEANASQCHGLSGLIDLLVATGDADDLVLARHVAGFVRRDALRAEGPRCGVPTGDPTPGLMLGIAGIAWGQLRAAVPGQVPAAWTPVGEAGDPWTPAVPRA